MQLLEAEDETLTNNIRSSPILLSLIKQLSAAAPASQDGSPRRGSISDDDDGGSTGESGASEIAALARRILDLTDGGSVMEGLADGRTGKLEECGARVLCRRSSCFFQMHSRHVKGDWPDGYDAEPPPSQAIHMTISDCTRYLFHDVAASRATLQI